MINDYDLCLIIYLINHSVVLDPNSINPFCTAKFAMFWTQRVFRKRFNSLNDLRNMLWIDAP